jgi:hypothetical protein
MKAAVTLALAALSLAVAATAKAEDPHPRWYAEGTLIPVGHPVTAKGSGTFEITSALEYPPPFAVKCKVSVTSILENHEGEVSGGGEVTSFKLKRCTATEAACPKGSAVVLAAQALPWSTILFASGLDDAFENTALQLTCDGSVTDRIEGYIDVGIRPAEEMGPKARSHYEWLGPALGLTHDSKGQTLAFWGTAKLTGPKGYKRITAH